MDKVNVSYFIFTVNGVTEGPEKKHRKEADYALITVGPKKGTEALECLIPSFYKHPLHARWLGNNFGSFLAFFRLLFRGKSVLSIFFPFCSRIPFA